MGTIQHIQFIAPVNFTSSTTVDFSLAKEGDYFVYLTASFAGGFNLPSSLFDKTEVPWVYKFKRDGTSSETIIGGWLHLLVGDIYRGVDGVLYSTDLDNYEFPQLQSLFNNAQIEDSWHVGLGLWKSLNGGLTGWSLDPSFIESSQGVLNGGDPGTLYDFGYGLGLGIARRNIGSNPPSTIYPYQYIPGSEYDTAPLRQGQSVMLYSWYNNIAPSLDVVSAPNGLSANELLVQQGFLPAPDSAEVLSEVNRTLQSLLPGNRYTIRVRAYNAFNVYSDWSEALEVTTVNDDSPPKPPIDLDWYFNDSDCNLSWISPTKNEDGTDCLDLSHFEVTFINPEYTYVKKSFNTTENEFTLTKYLNSRYFGSYWSFNVEIRAVDAAGNKSDPLMSNPYNPPPVEDYLAVAQVGNSVEITIHNGGNGDDIATHTIEKTLNPTGAWSELVVLDGSTYIDTHVSPGDTSYYRCTTRDIFNRTAGPTGPVQISISTSDGDKTYVHTEGTAQATWTIVHNLNKFPTIAIVDSGDHTVFGAIDYIDNNSCTVSFNAPISGKAYCN